MYAQVEKNKEKKIGDKSRVIANSVAQKKSTGKQGFEFMNNLSGFVAQTKLQDDAKINPQVNKEVTLQLAKRIKKGDSSKKDSILKAKKTSKEATKKIAKKKKNPDFYKRVVKGLPQDRLRFMLGQHGAKSKEQKRLKKLLADIVSGSTHESEHTIGYAVLADGKLPRQESKDAQVLENIAPAYQEVHALHRDHIGTGSSSTRDQTGLNADEYREMQRGLLVGDTGFHKKLANQSKNPIGISPTEKHNAVSNAVQINQLGYGQQLHSGKTLPKQNYPLINNTALKQANHSYNTMVSNMSNVTYMKDANAAEYVSVDDSSKLEMILARSAAVSGEWPKLQAEQINQLLDKHKQSGKWPKEEIAKVISTLKY
jgi:hypothetical protein